MYAPLEYTTGARAEVQFRRDAAQLEQTQAAVLMRYLDRARQCEFARRHGLEHVRTVREYQDAVPIADYDEALARDVARMQAGEQGVRFDDPVDAFVLTGGTSGRSKVHVQRTLRNVDLAARFIDIGVSDALLAHDHPTLSSGRHLPLVGGTPEGGIPFMSAFMHKVRYRASPAYRARAVLDPAWLDLVADVPTRFYLTARVSIGADVRDLWGLAPALLVFARTMADSTEALLRDVRDGTITAELSPAARAALPTFAPDPTLAATLAARAAPSGELSPRVAWPELCNVQCMMSGSLGNNRPALRAAYGAPLREAGYTSTEAPALAFPVRDEDENVLLGIHTAFCEFVDDADRVHLAHEVRVGRTYRLVLTTPHGLYRYDTHDLLEVTGHDLGGAPVVRFVARAGVVNLMGEKLSEVQVSDALRRAAGRLPAMELRQYVFVPRKPKDGVVPHYELLIEPGGDGFDPGALAVVLEAELAAANVLYETNRLGDELGTVRVTPTAPRWFELLRAHLQTLSQSAKVPVFLAEEQIPLHLSGGG